MLKGKDAKPTHQVELPFTPEFLPGLHPYINTVPQTVTEDILHRKVAELGGRVEWGTELTDFSEGKGGNVTAELNRSEVLKPRYMVGCDGAQSFVRKHQSMEFSGMEG